MTRYAHGWREVNLTLAPFVPRATPLLVERPWASPARAGKSPSVTCHALVIASLRERGNELC